MTEPTVHIDLVAHMNGAEYFLGHFDVSVNDAGLPLPSALADQIHQVAWAVEDINGVPDVDERTPVEASKAELAPPTRGRVFEDTTKGRWFEVRGDTFVHASSWDEAHHIFNTYAPKDLKPATEATLRQVYTRLKEVSE